MQTASMFNIINFLVCVLGYMIMCGYVTSDACLRQYSVVLNEVQAIAGHIFTSQNYHLEKKRYSR